MADRPVRYQSSEEDSGRWDDFPFRQDDIVISTRSKSGTTWVQMICALLVFQSPELPAPLGRISPWLDMLTTPREEVVGRLQAQQHRRIVKTHTPLDGVPIDPRATYIVVARHPLDAAVSLYHQGNNIDRRRMAEMTGQPPPADPPKPRPPLHDWLVKWIEGDSLPTEEMDSLRGYIWHLSDAWSRRQEPNIVLVHYDDLSSDLAGEMRRLAGLLRIEVAEERWPELVEAAGFEAMRARAVEVAPGPGAVFKDVSAFFRRGTSGAGREVLSGEEIDRYYQRTAAMGQADLLAWVHREDAAAFTRR
jgi:aryl sulfotransferase